MLLTPTTVVKMMGNACNSCLGNPCNMSYERTVQQQFKIIFNGFPMYPSGESGTLTVLFPANFIKVNDNNDIICRELQPSEIFIYNGKTANSTQALAHTNIFSSGNPCLGNGSGAIRIRDMYDFSTYIVSSALRINISAQSVLSPTTRQYGETPEQMLAFKARVREMLRKRLGDNVLELENSQIYEEIKENFNDQYAAYVR